MNEPAPLDMPEPFEMTVERGKVREFARATQSRNPAYLGDEQPVIPPTFLTTAQLWQPPGLGTLGRPAGLDLRRLLHGEQEYVFFGEPPRAGDKLTAQSRTEAEYEKEGKRGGTMRFVVTVTDFTDPAGRLVAQARSTSIITGKAPA